MKQSVITLTLIFQLAVIANAQVLPAAQRARSGDQKASEPSPQDPARRSDDEVVRITTNLVQVDPVITDAKGKPVTDLRPEEVQILEDGKPQQITNFSYVALDTAEVTDSTKLDKNAPPLPPRRLRPDQVRRTIALIVDDLGLSFESAYYTRQAVKKFVDQQLQPTDLVAIIRTSGGIGALQQFTTDKRQLYAAVEKIKWYPRGRGGVAAFAPINADPSSVYRAGDGRTFPQVDEQQERDDIFSVGTLGAVNYVVGGLRELPGRKSVVLLSEGFAAFSRSEPTGSLRVQEALRTLIDQANRASVVIYSVDPRGLQTLGFSAADNTAGMTFADVQEALSDRRAALFESQSSLSYLSHETGGLFIKNTNDLSGGIKRALEDQGSYYLIGYRPDESTFESNSGKRKFHKLTLKVLRPGKFNVRMRNGFYGVTDEEAKPSFRRGNPLVGALLSPFGASDIHVRLTSVFANDPKMGSIMRSMLHVKASDLTFKEEADGWQTADFDIIAYTFGDNGMVVDYLGQKHSIRVKGQTYTRVLKNGFTYHITVPVKKAGAYQLRTALRDSSSEKMGSASQFIEVPDIKKKRLTLSGMVLNGISQQSYQKGELGIALPQNNSDDTTDSANISYPSLRQFKSGLVMLYGFQIYNARLDKATQKPQLLTRVRLFRNGEEVFVGKEIAFDASSQPDLKRLGVAGAIQLGTQMLPGEYVVQAIVTDLLATGKHRVATQWMDLDIIK